MGTFRIIWLIGYVGVWAWTINEFIDGNLDYWGYLFPVFIMTLTNPFFFKKKK